MDFNEIDSAHLAVETAFVATSMLCVALSVSYARQQIVDDIKQNIRDSVRAIKQDLKKELDDVKARSNIDPPEDGGDGRSF